MKINRCQLQMPPRLLPRLICLLVLVLQTSLRRSDSPPILQDVGIDQKPGQKVPPDLTFNDEYGAPVHLGDYLRQRPAILTLVYYQCPMLCTMVLNDVLRSLRIIEDKDVGRDFDIITVSFDPRETPALALQKKQEYLKQYKRPTAAAGWHFLTGDQESITQPHQRRRLSLQVGCQVPAIRPRQRHRRPQPRRHDLPLFSSASITRQKNYASPSREADAQSKSRRRPTQIFLFCFHYDPSTGKYTSDRPPRLQLLAAATACRDGHFLSSRLASPSARTAVGLASPPLREVNHESSLPNPPGPGLVHVRSCGRRGSFSARGQCGLHPAHPGCSGLSGDPIPPSFAKPTSRPKRTSITRSRSLGWSIPFILVMVMFFWGAKVYVRFASPPSNAMQIHVIGKQWMWKIQHPEGRAKSTSCTSRWAGRSSW